jgi:ankyrin repeat protein
MWAAMNGHTEVVKALIEKGADVNGTEKVRCRHSVSTGEGMTDQRMFWIDFALPSHRA